MQVLFVCTANVCRSPAAEQLLSEALAQRLGPASVSEVEVSSAGIRASGSSAICPYTAALVVSGGASAVPVPLPPGGPLARHRSRLLTQEQIDRADLILVADGWHRSEVTSLVPAARSRTFLVVQAGRLAQWLLEAGMVQAGSDRAGLEAAARQLQGAEGGDGPGLGWAERFVAGDPRISVAPLPAGAQQRCEWMMAELREARGMAPRSVAPTRRRPRREGDPELTADDLPDPHVVGLQAHSSVFARINAATQSVADLLVSVLGCR